MALSRVGRLPGLSLVVSVLLLVVLGGALPAATALGPSTASPAPTPSASSDLSAAFAYRAGYVTNLSGPITDPSPATGSRLVVVTFQARDPSLFSAPFPGSHPLTMTELADRYGLTPSQYAQAERYFLDEGLSVVHTWPDRLSLTLSGSVSSVDRAFGTTLADGIYQGRAVSFPATPPALPSPIAGWVESVTGLSSGFDRFELPSLSSPVTNSAGVSPSQGSTNLVTPGIARQIYDLSSLYNLSGGSSRFATTESIAVLLWGPGYVPSDLQTFYAQYYPSSFPAPNIVDEPVDGAPMPSASAANDQCGAAEELTLDLEWSSSMAPGATLYAVYAPEGPSPGCSPSASQMSDALHTAIGLPIAALSMSFGSSESSDAALRATWDTYLAEAVQLGITPLAATGDLGGDASTGCTGGPSLQYPSSSPDVLAVGGTDVALTRSLLGQVTGFSESAWDKSGGGFSSQFSAPSWQNLGNPGRGEPDVSATAADNFLYFNGQPQMAGGTSFATPLWAGLVTEMEAQYGKSMAPLAPRLYSVGAEEPSGRVGTGLADITSGATCIGSAGPGWDPETGWGSPRALLLYEDLTATFVNLSVAVTPTSTGPGGSVTISAHLANMTSGAPIAGIPIDFSLGATTSLGPCTGSFGTASPSTGPNGNASVTIAVPSCYLGSSALARAIVESNGLYGSNSTHVPVNLLAFLPFLSGITTFPYNLIGFAGITLVAVLIGYFLGRPRRRTSRSLSGPPAAPGATGSPTPPAPASATTVSSPQVAARSVTVATGPAEAAPPAAVPPGHAPRAGETASESPKTK